MAYESLQPSGIFAGLKQADIPELKRKTNDKFWVIPIEKYSAEVKKRINAITDVDAGSKKYLIALVDYMDGKIKEKALLDAYAKNKIPDKDIIKNFGEIIGPFYALQVVATKIRGKLNNIVFPTRQNYEVFDFFIKNDHHYGFSSKALVGGSNPLVPRLIIERLNKMKNKNEFKKFENEITVLKELTDYGMFEGVARAFAILIKNDVNAKGFDSANKLFSKMTLVNLRADAAIFEKNKETDITKIKLSNVSAYEKFLDQYVVGSISEPKRKEAEKNGYQSVNVIYGMIKYISSIENFQFDEIMKHAFQDLYVAKMGLRKGIPIFSLQTTVDAKNIFKPESIEIGEDYTFRSKASWDRVRDKLGIQL